LNKLQIYCQKVKFNDHFLYDDDHDDDDDDDDDNANICNHHIAEKS